MSTTYLIYTEIRFKDGPWICACPYIKNKKGEEVLITTYESGSRSYFENTYDKLRELNIGVRFPEGLSETLRKKFYDDVLNRKGEELYNPEDTIQYYRRAIVCVPLSSLKAALPSKLKYQFHGVYHKDDIYRYETGEADYIEPVKSTKFAKLTEEEKKAYMYYEYDDEMDWPYNVKLLLKRIDLTVEQYINATASWGEDPEVRIIAFAL